MKIRYRFQFQKVGQVWVGAPEGPDAEAFKGMLRLSGTGYEIFSLLQEGLSEEETVARLKEKYTSGPVEDGVRKIITVLTEQGILDASEQ